MAWYIWDKEKTCGKFPLKVNQACFEVNSNSNVPLNLFTRNNECYECDFLPLGRQIKSNVTTRFIIDTEFGFESYFSNGNNSFCTVKNHFEDFGNIDHRNDRYSRIKNSRIKSLDAFRGLAILIMIFVNYNGGDYSVFKHSPWNGITIADFVFPWFIWIMGASTVLSIDNNFRRAQSKKEIFFRILKRSFYLIALGIVLNSGHRDSKGFLRVCGVLQRIGLTYFIIASLEIFALKSLLNEHFGPWNFSRNIIKIWIQWLVPILLVAIHVIITFTLHVPGCPLGYTGPGGLSNHSAFRNCTGGAAGYIDRLIITDNHMYHRGSFLKIFKPSVPFDPEGLLGTLTSVFCAFLGVQSARILINHENSFSKIKSWIFWAIVMGLISGFLCNWSQNSGIIPINKNLWSLSYVLATSSIAFLILTTFYTLIDFLKVWNGFPLIYPGMNAIALYLGHSLLKTQLPWRWVPFTNTHLELLVMDTTATFVWLLISYVLYKTNVFISL
ncbi:conserved hypothetical protein [Pediculus humanus corporis]|uniref:Heparan-alpha-glucosaminide N-acetyltransferase catalytic domain-containing protein n=1 Tax=Pediculus humanus subsp. corporis TaxID=121224 RepID=E0VE00_PEDHC|nr:uncharacterized protein Phum_PHUM127270 [Pediculus humanus corporis]EEB11606.1 conserved hypothetical protein [Pediculus humanus corporis]